MRPIHRSVMLHVTHQCGVPQEDQIHVPGLAQATPELAVAHAEMLLAVAVKGLGSGPASFIGLQDAMCFPIGAVRNQDFARLFRIGLRPQHKDTHRMINLRNADRCGVVPVRVPCHGKLRAQAWHQVPGNPRTGRCAQL